MTLLPPKLSRYAAIATLLLKYGPVTTSGTSGDEPSPRDAEQLADDLEKLGPTFVKLAQLLSTRPELLPKPYLDALARLQDDVEPFPFADVQRIVEEELGTRISKAFSRFDETPLAAASLGQVHRAALRDGRAVAVKIQRPDIVEQVQQDLEALQEVAQFLDRHGATKDRYNVTGTLRNACRRGSTASSIHSPRAS